MMYSVSIVDAKSHCSTRCDMNRYEIFVKQAHIGENGEVFQAWTGSNTTDPVKAVVIANESLYRRRKLGIVSEIKLVDYWE